MGKFDISNFFRDTTGKLDGNPGCMESLIFGFYTIYKCLN